MPLVRTGGILTHVQVLGDGDPTLVMSHGLLVGSLAQWYFTVAPALARTRRVVLYDLRGHGLSERAPAGYDAATLAGDLGSLLGAVGVATPVDLVGHSGGGLAALRFALDRPAAVRRLALVDVPLPPSSLEGVPLDAAGVDRLVESLPGPMREILRGGGRRAARVLDGLRFLVAEASLLRDLAREPDVPDDVLATLPMPVLCLYGASSRCLPVGRRLARAIPGARLAVLPGGHFLPLESPRELGAELQAFFHG